MEVKKRKHPSTHWKLLMKYPNFFSFQNLASCTSFLKKNPLYGVKQGYGELQHC